MVHRMSFYFVEVVFLRITMRARPGASHSHQGVACLFQGVALLPGVSRSGSTISAGLFSGMTRETSVKYSFILGIPVILMSCLLEVKDAVSTHTDIDWVSCAVGFVVAAFVGLCAIKLVNWLVKTDKFKVFAYYTLVLGVIVLVISFIEMCMGHPISFAK